MSKSPKTKSTLFAVLTLIVVWILIFAYWPKTNARSQQPYPIIVNTLTPGIPPANTPATESNQQISPLPTGLPAADSNMAPSSVIPSITPTPIPPLMISAEHLVQSGETVQSIADLHHTPALLLAGSLRVDELTPGNTIWIPVPNPQACPSLRIHMVVANETLYSLARRYNVTVEAIQAANRLDTDVILAADLLCIP